MYVIADEQLVKDQFMGLFKSMIEGLSRDGHARQIGDFLTIFPVVKGEFDLDKGWDKSVNEVRVYARLLNELTLDITDWVFNDVTPGLAPFKLHSVSSGSEGSTVTIDKAALTALESLEANGKTIVFDITCGNNRAVKSALVKESEK